MSATCSDCGTPLEPEMTRCPKCGSGNRHVFVQDTVRVVALDGIRLKAKDSQGFVEREVKSRMKISDHGNLAEERQEYDRTALDKTVKTHIVYEKIDGEFKLCHYERVESPAKRRPPHRLQPGFNRNTDADGEDKSRCPR